MPDILSPQEVGHRGEALAAEYLADAGYRMLASNWSWRKGEIDLIFESEDEVVFVEVKARRSHAFGAPEEAITRDKRRKLIQTAQAYLASHDRQASTWRIDVIAIDLTSDGRLERLDHYQSAVEAE